MCNKKRINPLYMHWGAQRLLLENFNHRLHDNCTAVLRSLCKAGPSDKTLR